MLTFNHLLDAAEISPEKTFLLRHQDTRMRAGQTLYRLWRYQPEEFSRYERFQGKRRFEVDDFVASFVVDPTGAVLFVSLSNVHAVGPNTSTIHFEFLNETNEPGTLHEYSLERDSRFADYEGRLVIDWGAGARTWCQRAHLQPKPILELRRTVLDVEWPGYMEVLVSEKEVDRLAPNWKAKLAAANGVYLLTCPETGAQYVGAAFGPDGFMGRWRSYAADGHGGNKLLRQRRRTTDAPLQISILEVFGSAMTEEEAYAAESRWKRSLGSRAHGLNAN
jgi:hypothetical protein